MKSIVDYATFEQILTVDWNKTVSYALRKMKEMSKSCLLVVERKGGIIGIVTEHDKESLMQLSDFCAERRFETINLEDAQSMDSRDAARYMRDKNFHRIVIRKGDKDGIFTSTDLIRMLADGY